jgi:TolB protein
LSGFLAIQSNQSAWAGTFPGPNGQIAFVSSREGDQDLKIYVMNADGTGQTRLTNNVAYDRDPSWSPDGEKIAFVSDRDGSGGEIYVMNADDGSEPTRLTNNEGEDLHPSWSPDGEKIAFDSSSDFSIESLEIYVMNADDGTGQTRLTDNTSPDEHPSWSPDGEKIAFESGRSGNYEIWVMNADDGSEPTRLTNNEVQDFSPDWGTNTSPPGSGDGTPTPSEQTIEEAISTIQNLDSVPQSLKTNLIALLRQVLDSLNDDTTITTNNLNVP